MRAALSIELLRRFRAQYRVGGIAAVSGVVMMVMMWTAALPPANNPFMDDHIVYALVLATLALTFAGRTLGLGRKWEQLAIVRRYPILK